MNNNQITCTVPYATLREYENMATAFLITIKHFKTDEEKQRLLDSVQAEFSGQGDEIELIKAYLKV